MKFSFTTRNNSIGSWLAVVTASASFLHVLACNEQSATQPVEEEPSVAVSWSSTDTAGTCLPIIKNAGTYGIRSDLPVGFTAYAIMNSVGLFVQNLTSIARYRVPNTRGDRPICVSIDDSADYIFYIDSYTRAIRYVRPDGSGKGTAPTIVAGSSAPRTFGLWRSSPNGLEYFYQSDSLTLRAVKYVVDASGIRFIDDRIVMNVNNSPRNPFLLSEQIAVCGPRIAGKYFYVDSNALKWGTYYATVPGQGTGLATTADWRLWENDPPDLSGSCGYAMSRDGSLLVHNVGDFLPPYMVECVAHNHKGFCVVPFDYPGPPANTHTFIQDFGYSVNWCPPELRNGEAPRSNDFGRWYFGNSSDYVIGSLSGTETAVCGIWLVEWRTNTWTSITSRTISLHADFPAVHFGKQIDTSQFVADTSSDTRPPVIDWADPCYQVVYPNGGESWQVGDSCEVKVRSYRSANAVLFLVKNGENSIRFPGLENSFNPRQDSVFTLVVPDSFYCPGATPSSDWIQARGDGWKIAIQDYSGSYADESDSTFAFR